jgi:hypothetical protein
MQLPKAAYSAGFALRRNAPTILTMTGVVGFCATTVLTARATKKALDRLPDVQKKITSARELVVTEGGLTERERQEALIRAYLEGAITMGKIYGPTLVTGATSIVCVLAGHNLLMKRNAAIAAAYSAMAASLKAYRARVAEEVGVDKERELYYEPTPCEIVDDDGQVVYSVQSDLPPGASIYARWFDETNPNYTKTPEWNLVFLKQQETWFNQRLGAHGYVFLNEVYEALGIPRTQIGQVVGWRSDAHDRGTGDGYIDLGIHDIFNSNSRAFVNGLEPVVLIDPNVDGEIQI